MIDLIDPYTKDRNLNYASNLIVPTPTYSHRHPNSYSPV